jgi:ApbE superfamily uncharacterized protein (UPF0280 family)
MTGPQVARLTDGRLHLHHGPIDIVLLAEGPGAAGAEALGVARFRTVLQELADELPDLRSPDARPLQGLVARALAAAVAPFRPAFITPMAAVAGAVADSVLAQVVAAGGVIRAAANNGGDIALHLAPGQGFTAAIAARPGWLDRIIIRHGDGIGGIATSGWRGRSQSLGIADAVTVLARNAAMADAAATMIANAVDLPGHPGITRVPARRVKVDSDLGDLPVTVGVGALSRAEATEALDRGAAFAQGCLHRGLIAGAALFLHPAGPRIIGALTLEPARA